MKRFLVLVFLLMLAVTGGGRLDASSLVAGARNMQSGTATMSSGAVTVTLTAVNLSKSIVVCSAQASPPFPGAACHLTNSTTLAIRQGSAGASVSGSVKWYVFEPSGVKSVQRGITTISGSTVSAQSVTITAVNPAKTYVITTSYSGGNMDSLSWGEVYNGTTLNLMAFSADGVTSITVCWQVVELQ